MYCLQETHFSFKERIHICELFGLKGAWLWPYLGGV